MPNNNTGNQSPNSENSGEASRDIDRNRGANTLAGMQEAYQREIFERLERSDQMLDQLAKMKAEQNDQPSNGANADASPEDANRLGGKMKQNHGMKGYIATGAAIGLAGAITFLAIGNKGNQSLNRQPADQSISTESFTESYETSELPPVTVAGIEKWDEGAINASEYSGELSNGVYYNYTEYSDTANKTSKNAYGYDKSECFGDRQKTEDEWTKMANNGPEYLGSYAYRLFTDEEKQELGIVGMTDAQIDNYMSNAENIDGGEKQRKIYNAIEAIARDQERTRYRFYYENDVENTCLIAFEDKNGDGYYTPDEMTLGYVNKKRNGAPQVDIDRLINGEWQKMLDLNMECGFQPNDENAPEWLPEIYDEEYNNNGGGGNPGGNGGSNPNDPTPNPNTPTPETPTPESPNPDPNNPNPDPNPNPTPPAPENPPQPKNQEEANENSGAASGVVSPEEQNRPVTIEPTPDTTNSYNSDTNTYDAAPAEQATQIGFETTNDSGGDATVDSGGDATVGTGEVTGDSESADGGGDTIQENLEEATGNPEANPTGDYSEGF